MHQKILPKNKNPFFETVERWSSLKRRIVEICEKSNRDPHDVKLVAVSKTHPAEALSSLYDCGQMDFGENYVNEWIEKQSLVSLQNISWHFLGKIQSNKIKKIAERASCIHALEKQEHAKILNNHLTTVGRKIDVFISINLGSEEQKTGVSFLDAELLAKFIEEHCPQINLLGLMAIPPAEFNDENFPDHPPKLYSELKERSLFIGKGKLSLGMSNDLRIAITAGSTHIRIGTAIFGERKKEA